MEQKTALGFVNFYAVLCMLALLSLSGLLGYWYLEDLGRHTRGGQPENDCSSFFRNTDYACERTISPMAKTYVAMSGAISFFTVELYGTKPSDLWQSFVWRAVLFAIGVGLLLRRPWGRVMWIVACVAQVVFFPFLLFGLSLSGGISTAELSVVLLTFALSVFGVYLFGFNRDVKALFTTSSGEPAKPAAKA